MQVLKLTVTMVLVALLGACSVTAKTNDQAKVKLPGDVTVEVGESKSHDGGFCPPGHAKKGWC